MLEKLDKRQFLAHYSKLEIIKSISNQKFKTKYVQVTRTIQQHFGCVNAIAFDPKGDYFASGGDDTRILVYPTNQLNSNYIPIQKLQGHVSNIFCIQFDHSRKYIYSCGNDGYLIQYDFELGKQSSKIGDVILAHEDSCLRLSLHPKNDNIILTAGQDWSIKLWDIRTKRVQGSLEKFGRRQNYVQLNPTNPYYFVTSDDRGGMLLYDLRSAFSRISPSMQLIDYTTRLCQDQKLSRPADVTSAVWNSDGTMLCANIQRWYPTLYSLNDPDPLCVFQDPFYSALATVKTGSFCDTLGTPYIFAGSDNATAYGWEIPKVQDLVQERQIHDTIPPNEISPKVIKNATKALHGHKSVVNSVVCHPELPYIATAGVEKIVCIHAPIDIDTEPDFGEGYDERSESDRGTLSFFSMLNEREQKEKRLWRSLEIPQWVAEPLRTRGNDDVQSNEATQHIESNESNSDRNSESSSDVVSPYNFM